MRSALNFLVICAGVLSIILTLLALSDLRHRRLPNKLVALYALLCPLALLASQAEPGQWMQHGLTGLTGFLLFLLLFALGGMGGGDVKLGAAVFAWAGTQSLWPALFVVGVTGLLLAVLGLLADALSKHYPPPLKSRRRKLARALSAKRGVPYGVALAAGGLAALPAYW